MQQIAEKINERSDVRQVPERALPPQVWVLASPRAGDNTQLLALADVGASAPIEVVANRPSSWSSSANAADYVILSHADFIPAVQPLKSLRAAHGHRYSADDRE